MPPPELACDRILEWRYEPALSVVDEHGERARVQARIDDVGRAVGVQVGDRRQLAVAECPVAATGAERAVPRIQEHDGCTAQGRREGHVEQLGGDVVLKLAEAALPLRCGGGGLGLRLARLGRLVLDHGPSMTNSSGTCAAWARGLPARAGALRGSTKRSPSSHTRGSPYHAGHQRTEPDQGDAGGAPRRPGARGGASQDRSARGAARAPNGPARPAGGAGRGPGSAAGADRHPAVNRREQEPGAAFGDGLRLRGGASTRANGGLAMTGASSARRDPAGLPARCSPGERPVV
jgi:hypothetical protein